MQRNPFDPSSFSQRWSQASKETKNAIYGIIAIAPTVGFALLSYYLTNDFKILAEISLCTSGLASAGFFGKSLYHHCQQPEDEEKKPLLIISSLPTTRR